MTALDWSGEAWKSICSVWWTCSHDEVRSSLNDLCDAPIDFYLSHRFGMLIFPSEKKHVKCSRFFRPKKLGAFYRPIDFVSDSFESNQIYLRFVTFNCISSLFNHESWSGLWAVFNWLWCWGIRKWNRFSAVKSQRDAAAEFQRWKWNWFNVLKGNGNRTRAP